MGSKIGASILYWKGKVKKDDSYDTEIIACHPDQHWLLLSHGNGIFCVGHPALIDRGLFHVPIWLNNNRMIRSKPIKREQALEILKSWLPDDPAIGQYIDRL